MRLTMARAKAAVVWVWRAAVSASVEAASAVVSERELGAESAAVAWAWVAAAAHSGELAGKAVVVNLSGRGDKDVAQVADLLGDRYGA